MDDFTEFINKPVAVSINARGWWLDRDENTYTVAAEGGKGRFQVGDRVNRELVDRFRLETVEPLFERRPVVEARGLLEDRPIMNQVCVWRNSPSGGRIGVPIFYKEIADISLIDVTDIANNEPFGVPNV